MQGQRCSLLPVILVVLGVLAPGVLAGRATAQPVESARSVPKDTTPYVRAAIPEDYAPGGRGAFTFTTPFMVDVVVSNTDPTLINTDVFNDSETSIAVNPQNPNEILITSFAGSWGADAPWWHSTDGGQTWTKRFTIPVPPGQPDAIGCPCDQTIDYGRNGRAFGAFLISGAVNDNVVTGGTNNPTSSAAWVWNAPGAITQLTDFNAPNNADQPWLLVNRDPVAPFQDNVYVAYDNFTPIPVQMRVSAALGTFPPVFTRDNAPGGTTAGAINPGHRLAVDPGNGWVYEIWQNCTVNCATLAADPKTIEYRFNRSRDGGATWDFGAGLVVATAGSSQPQPKFGTVNALLGGVLHAAVDPRNGDIYYVYGNNGGATNTNRLALRRLTTGPGPGNVITVGPERPLPGHGLSQAIPAVAVAENGVIGVFHYSFDGTLSVGNLPVFTARLELSDDQGVTWTPRALMTFVSSAADSCPAMPVSTDPCLRQRVLGDYMQMKAVGNVFYGAFTANGVPFGRPFANHDPIFFKVAATGTSELDLVVRGTDQGIYLNHFSGAFEGFQFLGGFTLDTPAVVAREGGAFDVVVRGTDSGIYHARFDGVTFSGFAPVGGFTPEAPVIVQGNYRAIPSTSAAIVPGVTRIDGTGCDDSVFQIALPFPVRFYGAVHRGLLVSCNGNVQFQGSDVATAFGNSALPTTSIEKAIFAYWDDLLTFGGGQGIFTATLGSAPNRQFVIEWRTGFFSGGGSANFEIVFFENSPVITVIYGSSTGQGNGASATTGVQLRSTGPHFTQFTFNSPTLTPGLRIDYVPSDLELIVRGTDNGIYHNTFNGTNWTGYTSLGGLTPSRPALAAGPNGTLELVVRGTDNGIYHNRFNGAVWSGYTSRGGSTNDAPALAARSTGVDLVVRGTDNGVYHDRFTFASATWSGFIAVGGATLTTPALVASALAPPGQLDLVVRGTDSGIYYNHFNGTIWTGYVAIPGATPARPALAASTGPGILDLVVRGTDNGIYYSHFNGAFWSPFVGLVGSMLSEPTLVSP